MAAIPSPQGCLGSDLNAYMPSMPSIRGSSGIMNLPSLNQSSSSNNNNNNNSLLQQITQNNPQTTSTSSFSLPLSLVTTPSGSIITLPVQTTPSSHPSEHSNNPHNPSSRTPSLQTTTTTTLTPFPQYDPVYQLPPGELPKPQRTPVLLSIPFGRFSLAPQNDPYLSTIPLSAGIMPLTEEEMVYLYRESFYLSYCRLKNCNPRIQYFDNGHFVNPHGFAVGQIRQHDRSHQKAKYLSTLVRTRWESYISYSSLWLRLRVNGCVTELPDVVLFWPLYIEDPDNPMDEAMILDREKNEKEKEKEKGVVMPPLPQNATKAQRLLQAAVAQGPLNDNTGKISTNKFMVDIDCSLNVMNNDFVLFQYRWCKKHHKVIEQGDLAFLEKYYPSPLDMPPPSPQSQSQQPSSPSPTSLSTSISQSSPTIDSSSIAGSVGSAGSADSTSNNTPSMSPKSSFRINLNITPPPSNQLLSTIQEHSQNVLKESVNINNMNNNINNINFNNNSNINDMNINMSNMNHNNTLMYNLNINNNNTNNNNINNSPTGLTTLTPIPTNIVQHHDNQPFDTTNYASFGALPGVIINNEKNNDINFDKNNNDKNNDKNSKTPILPASQQQPPPPPKSYIMDYPMELTESKQPGYYKKSLFYYALTIYNKSDEEISTYYSNSFISRFQLPQEVMDFTPHQVRLVYEDPVGPSIPQQLSRYQPRYMEQEME
jgi:hypothetical protein